MKKKYGRRGSALLIVLGMFAFMLVSAVSFSIYMRSSRAPSSYVRRNAAARHLVKAALARAIDEIDTAVGNDPFPGVGYNHDYGGDGISQGDRRKNDNWHGRVFTPSNEVAHAETVSTLTLEALGYLPPSLINEVRYWSRHTRTAKWHSFNYGLGQYAYTAVNVSDFFDLNQFIDHDGVRKQRLNRSSSEHGRISPTYLFRSGNESDMDSGVSAASAFLDAMSDGSGLGGAPTLRDVPLVSMMDFNLALGANTPGGIASPFMKRLEGTEGTFYSTVGDDIVRRQFFMAGGWNGCSNLSYQAYSGAYGGQRVNLGYPECQPFAGYGWFPEATTLSHCYNDVAENHPFWRPVMNDFPIISTALLCDYLDFDNVPLSLCIPCTEAVPMICGVELSPDCVKYNVAVSETELQPANPEQGQKKKIKRTYSLKVELNGLETTVTTVFPFINGPQGHDPGYNVEAFARVFFTSESSLADGSLNDSGLRTSVSGLGSVDRAQWDRQDVATPAYIQVSFADKSLQVKAPSGVGEAAEKDAVRDDVNLQSGNAVKEGALADLVFEVDEDGKETIVEAECKGYADSFLFFENSIAWDGDKVLDCFKGKSSSLKFRPSVAVWVRIKNGDDKTVDMVPAVPAHDEMNDFPANAGLNKFAQAMGGAAGDPLLRFFPKKEGGHTDTGVLLTQDYFKNNNGAVRNAEWKQKSYIANDPRINWAPEQWWATDQTASPKDLWFDNVKKFRDNNGWCDTDIFMSVSDQGYMQSVYEWMLIPQVLRVRRRSNDYNANGANLEWGVFEGGDGYDGEVNDSVNNVLHSEVMWRTYRSRAFLEGSDDSDWGRIDLLPFDETVSGMRVNPYTDVTNIMMGAFANMPRDWWAASTNHLAKGKNYMSNFGSFERNFLFEWSRLYDDVYYMSRFWMNIFRERDARDMYAATGIPDRWIDRFNGFTGGSHNVDQGFVGGSWDVLDWMTGEVKPASRTAQNHGVEVQGILQNDMTLAERKFLYGYLRGCFANTHQLFLVFVRAESAAGGGGAGSGARAVALVWRDPNAPLEGGSSVVAGPGQDNANLYLDDRGTGNEEVWRLEDRRYPPHRTRVLFYHQLD